MINEKEDFINALESYVLGELHRTSCPADYNNESLQIVDARNHLFCNVGSVGTDEERAIFALRDLCCINEDSMELVPNRQRLATIAKEYGLE